MFQLTDDLRIAELRPLVAPAILMEELPLSEQVSNLVARTRWAASHIIRGDDERLLVIVWPLLHTRPGGGAGVCRAVGCRRRALAG